MTFYVGYDTVTVYDTVAVYDSVTVYDIVSLYHIVSIYKVSSIPYKCRKSKMQKEQVRIKCYEEESMHWPVFCFR